MGMTDKEWIMVHEGIRETKDISKLVELLLLRELVAELRKINKNLEEKHTK